MLRATDNKCPRCGGMVPNNEHPGEYPGALSRVASIEICSACGTDEAMQDWKGNGATPMKDWPVLNWEETTRAVLAMMNSTKKEGSSDE